MNGWTCQEEETGIRAEPVCNHGTHHEYQLGLMFARHLENQRYYTAAVCEVAAFSKHATAILAKGKTENDLE